MDKKERIFKLEIDENNLNVELTQQAANFIFVAERAIQTTKRLEAAKLDLDHLTAKKDQEIRLEAETAGKKITEKAIEASLAIDPELKKARIDLIELKTQAEAMKALKEAWYMRKDLLIQLAIGKRAEMEAWGAEAVKMKGGVLPAGSVITGML